MTNDKFDNQGQGAIFSYTKIGYENGVRKKRDHAASWHEVIRQPLTNRRSQSGRVIMCRVCAALGSARLAVASRRVDAIHRVRSFLADMN